MSTIDEYIIERQKEQQELKLASLLDITVDELSNVNYDIYEDEGYDGLYMATLSSSIVIHPKIFCTK